MSVPEKRRSRRKRTDDVVEFYELDGALLIGVGRILNVSTVGALVESTLRLEPGQRLLARLRRKNRSPLESLATVIRVRGKGTVLTYGLEFINSRASR